MSFSKERFLRDTPAKSLLCNCLVCFLACCCLSFLLLLARGVSPGAALPFPPSSSFLLFLSRMLLLLVLLLLTQAAALRWDFITPTFRAATGTCERPGTYTSSQEVTDGSCSSPVFGIAAFKLSCSSLSSVSLSVCSAACSGCKPEIAYTGCVNVELLPGVILGALTLSCEWGALFYLTVVLSALALGAGCICLCVCVCSTSEVEARQAEAYQAESELRGLLSQQRAEQRQRAELQEKQRRWQERESESAQQQRGEQSWQPPQPVGRAEQHEAAPIPVFVKDGSGAKASGNNKVWSI